MPVSPSASLQPPQPPGSSQAQSSQVRPFARRCWRRRLLGATLGLGLCLAAPAALAAENIVFVSGAFRRSIPVADLEHLASSGEARGLLADVLRLSGQEPRAIARLLNQSTTLSVVLASRLLNTRIGEVLLQRLAQIIYPLQASSQGLQALRAAVILGIANNSKGLSALSFLRAYPNSELAVSLPALLGLMGKASSISDLVRFFSESPLDGLRGNADAAPATPTAPAAPAAPAATAPAATAPAATVPAATDRPAGVQP
jgi:hypothetical protein